MKSFSVLKISAKNTKVTVCKISYIVAKLRARSFALRLGIRLLCSVPSAASVIVMLQKDLVCETGALLRSLSSLSY